MYIVGWGKDEINIEPKGYAMFGYGMWHHRAYKKRTALYARTVTIQKDRDAPLILCCLDFGCITSAIRITVIQRLNETLSDRFDPHRLVLMATHTHSGPGGCGYEALYNMPTPGFVPEHLDAVVDAVQSSIQQALSNRDFTEIRLATIDIPEQVPVAWNRSIKAYNRNLDTAFIDESETYKAINRQMQVLGFYRGEKLHSLLSLFGVHATCLGNQLDAHDGDNKGYAATLSEETLSAAGVDGPVCIFAQATAGDVSPHFHGKNQTKIRKKIKGEAEYIYARNNGRIQSEYALAALIEQQNQKIQYQDLDAVLEYVDMSNTVADPEFSGGYSNAITSQACHGTAFIAGTPVDGVGAAKPLIMAMNLLSKQFKRSKLNSKDPAESAYYQKLYHAQGPKNIIFESGQHRILGKKLGSLPGVLDPLIAEMNAQVHAGAIQESDLVPHIVPIQLIRIGQLFMVCAPGEFTTTSGKRVLNTIQKNILPTFPNAKVWFASYCNDYMGYVTTFEEYQEQAYEGGHTLFGQWTLAAFQTYFKHLAKQICLPPEQRQLSNCVPKAVPQKELEKRTNRGNVQTAVAQKELAT